MYPYIILVSDGNLYIADGCWDFMDERNIIGQFLVMLSLQLYRCLDIISDVAAYQVQQRHRLPLPWTLISRALCLLSDIS